MDKERNCILKHPLIERWSYFIEELHKKEEKEELISKPFNLIVKLTSKYLTSDSTSTKSILDIGCETGKNAIHLIQQGHQVTLLDIAPNALKYTKENLKKLGLENGVVDSITRKIEKMSSKYGPFKAVIGTYVFSFISPNLFENVMKNNILGKVESGGYFAGAFFGEKHAAAKDPNLTILNFEKIEKLFLSMSFVICEHEEIVRIAKTILQGEQQFHTINIIAKRLL